MDRYGLGAPESNAHIHMRAGDALLIIDVQNDYLPGGELGVADGDGVLAPLNDWIDRFNDACLPIFATRDWHPPDHCSFHAQGGPWPPHCVAYSRGAEFAAELALPNSARVVSKGTRREPDAHSGFDGSDLHLRLGSARVRRLFVGGLATEHCVLNTVVDALRLGHVVLLLRESIRAVDVRPGDGERAIAAMAAAGAEIVDRYSYQTV